MTERRIECEATNPKYAAPALVLVVTLFAYARSGNPIVASKIFTSVSLFNQLRFPLLFYPMLLSSLADGKISLERIAKYLNLKEREDYVERIDRKGGTTNSEGGQIEIKNGNFLWDDSDMAIANINLRVRPGEVVAVLGKVGSGKSALLKSVLGELTLTLPTTSVKITSDDPEVVGYYPQGERAYYF